ncbi:DUF6356 family protein [Candidatus Pseudothioglobus singularis]|nr:DUF6356 family protein [Candidatus Pseudothioglobus singularis]
MSNIFSKHPKEVGETYLQHLIAACKYGFVLFGLFIITIIHAVIPFVFKKTVSNKIIELADQLQKRK